MRPLLFLLCLLLLPLTAAAFDTDGVLTDGLNYHDLRRAYGRVRATVCNDRLPFIGELALWVAGLTDDGKTVWWALDSIDGLANGQCARFDAPWEGSGVADYDRVRLRWAIIPTGKLLPANVPLNPSSSLQVAQSDRQASGEFCNRGLPGDVPLRLLLFARDDHGRVLWREPLFFDSLPSGECRRFSVEVERVVYPDDFSYSLLPPLPVLPPAAGGDGTVRYRNFQLRDEMLRGEVCNDGAAPLRQTFLKFQAVAGDGHIRWPVLLYFEELPAGGCTRFYRQLSLWQDRLPSGWLLQRGQR